MMNDLIVAEDDPEFFNRTRRGGEIIGIQLTRYFPRTKLYTIFPSCLINFSPY